MQSSRLFNDGTGNDRGGRLRVVDPFGEDTYDGVQLPVRKRFSNRSQFTVNYTWSDLRGNAEAGFSSEAECRACIGNDRDIGPYENDTSHLLAVGGIYQFPGEWQLSGLLQAESGCPITARSSTDPNGNGRRGSTTTPPRPHTGSERRGPGFRELPW